MEHKDLDIFSLNDGDKFSVSSQDDPRDADWELFYHFVAGYIVDDSIQIGAAVELYECPDITIRAYLQLSVDRKKRSIYIACGECGGLYPAEKDIIRALNLDDDYSVENGQDEKCVEHYHGEKFDWERVVFKFGDDAHHIDVFNYRDEYNEDRVDEEYDEEYDEESGRLRRKNLSKSV